MPSVTNHLLYVLEVCLPAVIGGQPLPTYQRSPCPDACSGHGVCSTDFGVASCMCAHGWAGRNCGFDLSSARLLPAQGGDLSAAATLRNPTPASLTQTARKLADGREAFMAAHPAARTSMLQAAPRATPSAAAMGGSHTCLGGCSGSNGRCIQGACFCRDGFYGPTCAEQLCPAGCGGHGRCTDGGCLCHPGWSGLQCELTALVLPEHGSRASLTQRVPATTQALGASARMFTPKLQGYQTQPLWPLQRNALRPFSQTQVAVKAAAEAADRLLASAKRQADRDAALRVRRAVAQARSHAARLPGHEFAAAEVDTPSLSLLDVGGARRGGTADATHGASSSQSQELMPAAASSVASPCGLADCSGHGTCNATTAQCECDDGWLGAVCDTKPCEDNCSARGLCVNSRCVCHESFYGDACQNKRCPSDCSGHGYCFQGRCQCTGVYGGLECDTIAYSSVVVKFNLPAKMPTVKGMPLASVSTLRGATAGGCSGNCSGHGTCDTIKKECVCDADWFGESCSDYCPESCNSHGSCEKGSCLCYAGWSGYACSMMGDCNSHGNKDPATNECSCDPGWSGPECNVQVVCPDPLCSGHGICQDTGFCMCAVGWSGVACEASGQPCTGLCGEHGTCDASSNMCDCDVGWTGRRCEIGLYDCPNDCNGHGTCLDGACSCFAEWEGAACNVTSAVGLITNELKPNCTGGASLLQAEGGPVERCGPGVTPSATPSATQRSASSQSFSATQAQVLHNDAQVRLNMTGPSTAAWIPRDVPLQPLSLKAAATGQAADDDGAERPIQAQRQHLRQATQKPAGLLQAMASMVGRERLGAQQTSNSSQVVESVAGGERSNDTIQPSGLLQTAVVSDAPRTGAMSAGQDQPDRQGLLLQTAAASAGLERHAGHSLLSVLASAASKVPAAATQAADSGSEPAGAAAPPVGGGLLRSLLSRIGRSAGPSVDAPPSAK